MKYNVRFKNVPAEFFERKFFERKLYGSELSREDLLQEIRSTTYEVETEYEFSFYSKIHLEDCYVDLEDLELVDKSIVYSDLIPIVLPQVNSKRGSEWVKFSDIVLNHIENYAVPQYKDYPYDQMTNWSVKELASTIGKYASRYGSNQRSGQELLDFIKMAHCSAIAYFKEEKLPKEETVTITKAEYEELKAVKPCSC